MSMIKSKKGGLHYETGGRTKNTVHWCVEEMPESGGDFVPQNTGGEGLMPQDCPEIGEERLKAKVRNNTDCDICAFGGRDWRPDAKHPKAGTRGQRSEEIPESGCEFVLQDAGGELVMR